MRPVCVSILFLGAVPIEGSNAGRATALSGSRSNVSLHAPESDPIRAVWQNRQSQVHDVAAPKAHLPEAGCALNSGRRSVRNRRRDNP